MRMSWYYRMMLSYTPIFFLVISSVIFIFFTTLNHASENRYIETNKAIVEQMMQNLEADLKLIERNAVSALITDRKIEQFFFEQQMAIYDYYVIQQNLIALKSTFPFPSSIYLYDEANKRILSDSNIYDLDTFADRSFLVDASRQSTRSGWTEPRDYTLSTIDNNKQKVVSIVKTYSYSTLQKGTIVINIYVSSLMEFLNKYSQEYRGTIHILDTDGQQFQTPAAEHSISSRLRVASDYTGWTYYTDTINASGYSALSLLSNVWIITILVIIVLALIWFTFITHIHYRPIQNLVDKINAITVRKSGTRGVKTHLNEFKIIESAIDSLLAKAIDYNTLQEAEALHRKRILLQELTVGHRKLSDLKWKEDAVSLGLPADYDRICVVAVEIDRYSVFTESYKPGDQHLLKYILESAFIELANDRGVQQCCVWTEPQQASFILFLKEPHSPYPETIYRMCEEYRGWIHANLQLTVSVGIGTVSNGMEAIAQSYRHACINVSYKAVFGTNSVIDNRLAESKPDNDSYALFSTMPEMVHLLRKGDNQWRNKLSQIMGELQSRRLGRAELASFTTSLAQYIEKELTSMPVELTAAWHESYSDRFEALAEKTETLGELHRDLEVVMSDLAMDIGKMLETSSSKSIAMRMKAYIDANYTDSELSLVGVSEEFDMPVSNASLLFKKEIGEKFIDYVLKVRLEHARGMLVETDDPIQSIAEKVGYSHVLSFHRAFKKVFGFPPGEYRAIYRTHR
ncbi:hypothetical protein GCM10023310_65010 [Paenibacillus vulneris]|uniref:Helix-turn-helix domain-containing protein n=1 Tax=Paenibacillus vulneris TaxID=1133364 RepID=A0ABW3UWZ7_9BACL